MSADSPRRSSGSRGPVPAIVPPQVVSDRSILDSAIGFINDVTLAHQPHTDPKDTITWARFEYAADISDPRFGEDWELEGNVAPPLLLILGYGLGVQMWAIPANGEAVEVLSWRHGIVTALRVLPTPASAVALDENGRADEPVDAYAEKRPLIAMVDGSTSTGAQPQFCAVNFVSLKTGTHVKTIKFKYPVLDILANRSSIVITLHERIAVFDARTLEDRLTITTCFPSPGINPNPVALGPRWLAYAEHKLMHTKRSGGGCDGEGVASYTATVLNAAKSFGKGLRELGEQVAAGLTGTAGSVSNSKNNSFDSVSGGDAKQPGIVTIMDIKHPIKDYSPTSGTPMTGYAGSDPIVAHFIAHSEAVVALEFDNTGMLLLTADRRGHDFHIFRIQPHPVGSSLAAVHHLYVLHRGDTSAKVQNITFSLDSRWAAVSTLRGTTHVFPITPYGGPMGVRTHSSLHVVNKLSRFHRSAGLSADGRSSSPISHSESTTFMQSLQPYHNPTLPPFPRPSVVLPLAQLRQPFALGSPPGSATLAAGGKSSSAVGGGSGSSQRQRLSSLSDDNGKPLSVCGIFAKSRSWLLEPPNTTREASHRIQRKAVDSLFVMAGHGALIQYDLDTKLASNVAKEKMCDDAPIELEVEAKAQWNLGRRKDGSQEIMPPLSLDNWLIKDRNSCMLTDSTRHFEDSDDRGESWLSQVEIITHAGPHRRLWMGPQFVFKTYNTPSGSNLSHVDVEAVEIGVSKPTTAAAAAAATRVERSSPLNMPLSATARSAVPVLIESGSYSSIEQSPKLMDRFRHEHLDSDFAVAHGDSRLKEDLADAMRESPSVSAAHKDAGRLPSDATSSDNVPFYDALAEHEHDDDDQAFDSHRFSSASAAALASALPHISSYDRSSSYESLDSLRRPKTSIEKVVNPLGTVTTVTAAMSSDVQTDILDEVVSQLAAQDCVIHENCDESLFRPVVAIFCDENTRKRGEEEARKSRDLCKPPEAVGNKLIVPVIAKEDDAELSKKEKLKSDAKTKLQKREQENYKEEQRKFAEFSYLNKKTNTKVDKDSFEVLKEEVEKRDFKIAEKKKDEEAREKEPKAMDREFFVEVKEQEKPSRKELIIAEKPAERIATKVEDKSRSISKASNQSRKSEVREIKLGNVLEERKEVERKVGGKQSTVKELAKKDSSMKAKSSEERELMPRKNSAEEEEKPLEFVRMTPLPAEKHSKQTADNAQTSVKRKTAAAENNSVSKATIKPKTAETKTATNTDPKVDNTEKVAKNKMKAEGTVLRTEELNVSHLADSLIDTICDDSEEKEKDKVHEPMKKSKNTEKSGKIKEKPLKSIELLEPVEIYPVPSSSKKIKQKANKAESNLEMEEVIGTIDSSTSTKSKRRSREFTEEEQPQMEKKSSISSEDSYTDLADSLLENKANMDDTMYVSLTQTEQKKLSISSDEKPIKKLDVTEFQKTQKGDKVLKKGTEDTVMVTTTIEQSEGELKKDHKKLIKAGVKTTAVEKEVGVGEKITQKRSTKVESANQKSQESEEDTKVGKEQAIPKVDDVENECLISKKTDGTEKDIDKKSKKESKDKIVETKKANDNTTKDKELKGDIKKESYKKESTAEGKTTDYDEIKKDTEAIKNVIKAIDTKTKSASKTDAKSDVIAPKSPKNKVAEVLKSELEIMRPPVAPFSITEDRKAKKTTVDSKLEEIKVITEQPTKSKKFQSSEEQPSVVKEDKRETSKAENVIEVTKREKKNFRAEAPKPDSTEDVTDGAAMAVKNAKSKTPTKNLELTLTTTKTKEVSALPSAMSAWKMLSGAEMINKNMESLNTHTAEDNHLSLDKETKNKTSKSEESKVVNQTTEIMEKLLPDLPTPVKSSQDFKTSVINPVQSKNNKKSKKAPPTGFDDFPLLKPLEALPPLPDLEPLEVFAGTLSKTKDAKDDLDLKDVLSEQVSLINFESPLQENPALERKITPPPRGFTEQNLIFALCGSLHYENESPKVDVSPTLSLTRSSSAMGEQSTADYKSLTENDDQYMSLDQSSQDTNTTNTATTNEKVSSSPNSSASEEIVVLNEKKLTKKQRRKKQQMELERQREQLATNEADVDEELRPLISMTDSHLDHFIGTMTTSEHFAAAPLPLPARNATITSHLMDESFSLKSPVSSSLLGHSTTTDSEGPMPATTSDDNVVFTLPSASASTTTLNKMKTKKLEHKINLIGAIEAATSSSTSSAEESGFEGGGRSPSELDGSALVSVAATATHHPLPPTLSGSAQQSAAKKKTKRRKR